MQLSQEKHDTITDRTLYVLLIVLEFAYPCAPVRPGRGLWFHKTKDFGDQGIVDWMMNEVKMAEDVRAEIVASVLEVVVHEGEQISEGDTVVLLESMKMEIPVLAETGGTVSKVAVKVGDVIQAGDLIAVIG
ncbi:hypothetical protein MALGJ_26910 [Mycolicibacter algericus]|nr:hypothetical protein MALGJ_26910 [Mycolicibacter algericus]